jgi:beta-N-acetylhexosaminidase
VTIAGVRWRIRPFVPAADREAVAQLWTAALASAWPLLPAGIAMLGDGVLAEDDTGAVGFAAADLAGIIPLILVRPDRQRQGIGTRLLAAALENLRAAGVTEVRAASGGSSYIWPGVPRDLPAALRFFAASGWLHTQDVLDLVTDLARYRPPAAVYQRAADAGVSLVQAASADLDTVLAFEAATFPSWVRWFAAGTEDILVARDSSGTIAGTLVFAGPGADTVYAPMLGPAAGTIGCVGVAPQLEGRGIGSAMVAQASEILGERGTRACHISWTSRESFYVRVGYQPWRRYAMFRKAVLSLPGRRSASRRSAGRRSASRRSASRRSASRRSAACFGAGCHGGTCRGAGIRITV